MCTELCSTPTQYRIEASVTAPSATCLVTHILHKMLTPEAHQYVAQKRSGPCAPLRKKTMQIAQYHIEASCHKGHRKRQHRLFLCLH
jgi:hypothetical protein